MKKLFMLLLAAVLFPLAGEEKSVFLPAEDGGFFMGFPTGEKGVLTTRANRRASSKRRFNVDLKGTYKVSGKFKKADDKKVYVSLGVKCFDKDGKLITSPEVLLVPKTEIVLSSDVKKGAKEIYSKDASSWFPLKKRPWTIRFNAQKDHSDLPNRNWGPGIAKVEKLSDQWKITLRTPVPASYKAGTLVRQHYHGAGRNYCAASSRPLTGNDWVEFSGTISGEALHGAPVKQFWRGTKRAALVIGSYPGKVLFKDIKLEKVNGKVDLVPVAKAVKKASKKAPAKAVKQAVNKATIPMYLTFDPAKIKALQTKYRKEIEGKIHGRHPRLYCNEADFARMREQVKKDKGLQSMVDYLKYLANEVFPNEFTFAAYEAKGPKGVVWYGLDKFGSPSFRCALLYKLTGEKKYFDKAVNILRLAAKWYNYRYDKRMKIDWYAVSRLNALWTYDWLYNEMSAKDRSEIGKDLMRHFNQASDRNWVVRTGLHRKAGEGVSSWWSSFYGPPLLKFYTGLVFHDKKEGGTRAKEMLWEGLNDHVNMLNYRSHMAGKDGGMNNSTLGYVSAAANYCEWFFFHQWKFMTGRSIAEDFPQIGLFPHFLHYATFTGIDGKVLEHGSGSAWHTDNRFKHNNSYLLQYRCFFPDSPAGKLVDYWVQTIPSFRHPKLLMMGSYRYNSCFPHLVFKMKYADPFSKPDMAFFDTMPKAYYFRNLGQLYMYSSRKPDATYALFTCGARSGSHKQPDEGNFIIYKGGFLAMDTGTRVHSLKVSNLDYYHDSNYYSASVAHNVVLIHMEGEKFGAWPHPKYAVTNHGGMNKTIGGVVRAYETNDEFTYISGDTTATYHEGKCKKMLRQFVFVQEDYFVICDTVESVKPSQTKTWLLHSQKKPSLKGDTFSFDEEQGRLFCRTFLPKDYKHTVIGGKGKDFFVDGKNFNNIDPDYMKLLAKRGIPDPKWGNYRVELTKRSPAAKVRFLNLIQVGLQKDTPKMVPSKYVTERGMEGVTFTKKNGDVCTVLFTKDGSGGHIRIVRKGKKIVDRALTKKIQNQVPFKK